MGTIGSRLCFFSIDTSDVEEFPKSFSMPSQGHLDVGDYSVEDESSLPCLAFTEVDLDAPPKLLDSATGSYIVDDKKLWPECWKECSSISFETADSALYAAKGYERSGDIEGAFMAYKAALAISAQKHGERLPKTDAAIYEALGELCLNTSKIDEALSLYEVATWLDSKNVDYWFRRGVVYETLSKFREAYGCFQRCLQLQPGYVPALFNLGALFQRMSDPARALPYFTLLLDLEPTNLEALVLTAECLSGLGRITEAIIVIDRVVREDPTYHAARKFGEQLRLQISGWSTKNFSRHSPFEVELQRHDQEVV